MKNCSLIFKKLTILNFLLVINMRSPEARTQPETNPNLKLVFVLCNYSAIVRSVLTSALGNLPPPLT